MDEVRRGRVRQSIVAVLAAHTDKLPADRIGDDTPLFEGGLELDSLELMNVIIEVEDAVGVRLDEKSTSKEVLTNVGSVVKHVISVMQRAS